MAPVTASFASSDDLSLSTSGGGAGPGARGCGGLRRVQSAPVLPQGPTVVRPSVCPALAWADMLELDALPDDSHTSSGGAGLSAILAGLDAGTPSPAASRQHSPAAACTPSRAPFEAPFDTLPPKAPATPDPAFNGSRTRLSTKARPFVAAGVAAAETLLQGSPCTWALGRDGERPAVAQRRGAACTAAETRTTVMMRNVPYRWTRQKLLALLDSKGFAAKYDFVYIPVDFETTHTRGYSFVNLTSVSHVKSFVETFEGFCDWQSEACKKECQVCWSETQTLQSNILRYKDNSVMDPSVPDDYKPIALKDGVRIPFPQSIREYREFGQRSRTRKGWRRTTNIAFSATRGGNQPAATEFFQELEPGACRWCR